MLKRCLAGSCFYAWQKSKLTQIIQTSFRGKPSSVQPSANVYAATQKSEAQRRNFTQLIFAISFVKCYRLSGGGMFWVESVAPGKTGEPTLLRLTSVGQYLFDFHLILPTIRSFHPVAGWKMHLVACATIVGPCVSYCWTLVLFFDCCLLAGDTRCCTNSCCHLLCE